MSVRILSHHGAGCIKGPRMPLTSKANNNICSSPFEQHGEQQTTTAVATELEIMKLRDGQSAVSQIRHQRFPPACLRLLRSLPGNNKCIDCGQSHPEWASISHGALLCLSCAGKHRGLGVNTSKVRSVSMDSWSHTEVLSMLEGGNDQLSAFYVRHYLCKDSYCGSNGSPCSTDAINLMRYKTKAALFYRKNLDLHIDRVCALGVYKGREVSRKLIFAMAEQDKMYERQKKTRRE